MKHVVEVLGLKKNYGKIAAVRDISFYVEEGKLFAFLGPNGAGKSTTINTICTFLKPDAGIVRVNGYLLGREDDRIRENIGIVFQESLLDEYLTVEENLRLRAGFYRMSKKECRESIKKAAEAAEITGIMQRYYGRLSGGQRRRVDIARALLHMPKVLVLDEPTTGLDTQTRKSVWDTVRRLQTDNGMTVFLTTHYLEEAEAADYCMIVDDGRIADRGTPLSLKEKYVKDRLLIKAADKEEVLKELLELGYGGEIKGERIEVQLPDTLTSLPLLNKLKEKIEDFEIVKGSMDELFIKITGKEIRE